MNEPQLPPKWNEVYYDVKRNGQLLSVTAAYEHEERLVKIIIEPDGPAHSEGAVYVAHDSTLIHPVSENVGVPTYFREPVDELQDFLRSTIPSVSSRGKLAERNAGPYEYNSAGYPKSIPSLQRYPAGSFDWSDVPHPVRQAFSTRGEYISYETLVDAEATLSGLDRLWRVGRSGLVENPHPVSLTIEADDEGYHLTSSPQLGSSSVKEIGAYLRLTLEPTAPVDVGADVGTAYFDFQRDGFPTLNTLDLTETGEQVAHSSLHQFQNRLGEFFR